MFFGLGILVILLIWWFFKPKKSVTSNVLEMPPIVKTQIDTFTNSIKQAVTDAINKATKDISGSVSGAIQGAGAKASDAIKQPFERFAIDKSVTPAPELIEPYTCMAREPNHTNNSPLAKQGWEDRRELTSPYTRMEKHTPPPTKRFWISARH